MNRDVFALRAAICAAPGDDAPRRALANAYEAAGAADRARLIRLQLERAQMARWDPGALDLELEERRLLAEHGSRWREDELPEAPDALWGPFERGLVASAYLGDPGELAEHAGVFRTVAPLTRLFVEWPYPEDPPLPAVPGLAELTMVGTVYEPSDLRRLRESAVFPSLRRLTLLDAELRGGLEALLDGSTPPSLRSLRIPHHHLGTAGLAPLVDATELRLEELVLIGAPRVEGGSGDDGYLPSFDARGAYALALWPGLSSLRALDLSDNRLGVDGVRVLLGSPRTASLRKLALRNIAAAEWDMDDSLSALAHGPAGSLEELDISGNDLDAEAAHALAVGAAFEGLRILSMSEVRAHRFMTLSGARWIHTLAVLGCDAAALPSLLAEGPRSLHTLTVSASASDDVVGALAAAPTLPALSALEVRGDALDDASLLALGGLEQLPRLSELVVRAPGPPSLSERGVVEFLASPLGRRLASVDLGHPSHARLPRPTRESVGHGAYRGPLRTP